MIMRIWRARATRAGAESYRAHFTETVLPALERVPGHLGAWLLVRGEAEPLEIQVLTRWESLAAVRGFAGAEYETAVVEPAARAVLLDFDSTVTHHTVVAGGG
ncbi:antibiotic biosynthesis monooxygenase family protein [Amycolatopsis nigrescens]|uniref:antibiotic biosynthesis monooxygenase family protein n=1 Tax=Amycolatopsis nigrescens TaxID=381445 RepID=UPI00037EDB7D|nr:antibiotic biosynthesis monooxygenase [Amycolatopsis nigrescens]